MTIISDLNGNTDGGEKACSALHTIGKRKIEQEMIFEYNMRNIYCHENNKQIKKNN
jgi:hypothetical protein